MQLQFLGQTYTLSIPTKIALSALDVGIRKYRSIPIPCPIATQATIAK
ncbi:MAG: hypothetical protein QNJ72_18790 [Pleurocapsa sp. MO_226.B13]|nr:hypothetical protein [Pleurocapsa sp. MO_226.B13]